MIVHVLGDVVNNNIIMWRTVERLSVSIALSTRMLTASKITGDLEMVTDLIVFLCSFFFLRIRGNQIDDTWESIHELPRTQV